MLGELESPDALRADKEMQGGSYAAEGRIKVNSPKLLLSEGHLRLQKRGAACGKSWGERGF